MKWPLLKKVEFHPKQMFLLFCNLNSKSGLIYLLLSHLESKITVKEVLCLDSVIFSIITSWNVINQCVYPVNSFMVLDLKSCNLIKNLNKINGKEFLLPLNNSFSKFITLKKLNHLTKLLPILKDINFYSNMKIMI
jgi:hypothetical protein